MVQNTAKRIYEATSQIDQALKGAVVVIGNFDGVHLGHKAVLENALNIAENSEKPAIVFTFEPHPRTWFDSQNPVFRITPADQKAKLLLALGFDAVVYETFNSKFADLSAEVFIKRHLVENLAASHVITGYNFHFGKKRSGTPQMLQQAGQKYGFQVTLTDRFADHAGERISSSRIRASLEDGDVKKAAELLGRNWQVCGTVIKGAQIGRTLGYPTANLKLPEETALSNGIYAVKILLADGRVLKGVASFGRRPTFDNGARLLETFIFDFDEDLYGKQITVEFIDYIRPELKFPGVDKLVQQMDKDTLAAKTILETV